MVGTAQDKAIRAGYKETEVGMIPEEWLVESLIDCCDYVDYRGKTPRKTQSGTLLITARNVRKGFIDYEESKEYVATDQYDLIMRRGKPQMGDVIITTEAPLGNVAQIDREDVALAQRIIKYRPRRPDLSANYLKHYLLSDRFQGILDSHASGSTARGIKGSVLHQLPVVIPRPDEEKAIATALSDADALIVAQDELIAKKRSTKQAVMQQLLTGEKRLAGFSGKWEVKKLGELLSYEQPVKYLVKDTEYSDTHSTPVLTAGKTFILGYTAEETGIFRNLPTIIFDDFTTATKYVDFPFKAKSSAMKMLRPRSSSVNLRFMFERIQLIDFSVGDHKRYWISEYQDLEVEMPECEEQTAIASVASDMDAEIAALQARREKTNALKQGMMQQLLTGNIRLV